jgi:Ni/Fe-hydrogenase subunit HybB-like protein
MRLSYTPGFDEILMMVGAIIAYIALLLLGTLLLPLEQERNLEDYGYSGKKN